MKKISTLLIGILAMMFISCDEDVMTAYRLEGDWYGDMGMFYGFTDRYGRYYEVDASQTNIGVVMCVWVVIITYAPAVDVAIETFRIVRVNHLYYPVNYTPFEIVALIAVWSPIVEIDLLTMAVCIAIPVKPYVCL